MNPRADFYKIIDKKGKLLGVLNYNLMIPVGEKYYKQLCIDELNWCRKHADVIINKANCLYQLCTSESNYKGKERCLDFKRLEIECEKYNMRK